MSVRPQVTLARGSTELRDSTFRISSVAACTRVARCDFGSVVTDILCHQADGADPASNANYPKSFKLVSSLPATLTL
jgi:hypothetical protein